MTIRIFVQTLENMGTTAGKPKARFVAQKHEECRTHLLWIEALL